MSEGQNGSNGTAEMSDTMVKARDLLATSLVIDSASGHIVAPEPPPVDGKSYLQRMLDVGINMAAITVAAHNDTFDEVLRQIFNYQCLMAAQHDKTLSVMVPEDILEAQSSGRLGLIFMNQTSAYIGGDTWKWSIMHKLGLRQAQLTYNERNVYGDGCREPENRGLTSYGYQAIQEINQLGICLDISHTGERTSMEAIEYSSQPVIASHANCRHISPSQRNLSNDMMKAVAESGGVMGLTPHSAMAFRTVGDRPTISDYLDQFDYAVEVVGIDHVGIGTDLFESYTKLSWESSTKRMYPNAWIWETMYSEGFNKLEGWTSMVAGLIERGYTDSDIRKLLGENWLRVYNQVWSHGSAQLLEGTRGWQKMSDTIAIGAG